MMRKLNIQLDKLSKRNISDIHIALGKLTRTIADDEINNRRMGETTTLAINDIQKRNNLHVTGKLDAQTLEVINNELHDAYYSLNKTRTKRLHALLEKVKLIVAADETRSRRVGNTTRKAIEIFQKQAGFTVDGKLTEAVLDKLHETVITETYKSKNQRSNLHKILQKVNSIAKLNVEITPNELKEKTLGITSQKLINAFQEKYKLPVTGKINKATLDKLNSVSSSKGKYVKKLKVSSVKALTTVTKTLRLNMVSPQVAEMQKELSFLGYQISEKEFKMQTFGKTTIKAIKAIQKEKGIAQTGHFDKATSRVVNNLITIANPDAAKTHRYRIRGSVRDELWQRKNFMVIKLYEKILDKVSTKPLAAMKNFLNGFFDIAYEAPINPVNGKIKDKFHLVVKLYDAKDQDNPVAVQTHCNVNPIHWVNFTESKNAEGVTEYNGKYAGKSEYEITGSILQKAIGKAKIEDLKETDIDKQISQLSLQTGLSTDDIMRHVLSRLVAKSVDVPEKLSAEVFYVFIRLNVSANLSGDLLRETSEWEAINDLIEATASGIVFLDDSIQQQAVENAILQNIVSQKIKVNQDSILKELQKQRIHFTLIKPILVGDSNLLSLLDQSKKIDSDHYQRIASVFFKNRDFNSAFWQEIKNYIGIDAIADFKSTVAVGSIAINHGPTVTFIKNKIGTGPDKLFKTASDIAKLDQQGLIDLINQNDLQVPDDMLGYTPDDTLDEKVVKYATAMKNGAELLFPAVSLVAALQTSSVLAQCDEIEAFIDENKDFNLREQNIDKYFLDHPKTSENIDAKTKEELKIVQRIHKITLNSLAGFVLIDERLHSSMQIYFLGKDRLTSLMAAKGVKALHIHRVYESSKMQYMQILARLMDFRREMHRDTPKAIVPHTYSKTDIQNAIGNIPDLEVLFGSLDYCDCEHCKSLYSPSAYLTDMLRYLNEHLAIDKSETVKDILFKRRPDLGNIKLNCVNTETPLPYIDLVCEILENNLIEKKDFVYQTTLSQKELRAIPQYIRSEAYEILANADFPMSGSFNLWQEEARTYLNYLRVPRFELMEAFQDKSDPNNKKPDDAAIASEYFGISFKEKDLIITERKTAIEQKKYWELEDITQTSIAVSQLMKCTKLSYYELLELLLVKFVNDPEASLSKIETPVDSCDVDLQVVINLTVPKLDLMHRFIRLWRKTNWKMWELDLLIRAPKIGNKVINNDTLANLKRFKLLQEKLRLPFETLLAFFGEIEIDGEIKQEINREVRIAPDRPDIIIQPLYNKLFQNKAVATDIDEFFKAIDNLNEDLQPIDIEKPYDLLKLKSGIKLGVNSGIIFGVNPKVLYKDYSPVPTILSALGLQQADFDLLVDKTNKYLSVDSLAILLRYVYLARSLKLSINDLLMCLGIINYSDPFSSLQATLDSIKHLEHIKSSGLSLHELDYILTYNSNSSIGLRNETIAQLIESLRKILVLNKEKIDQLQLSIADRNSILTFDADALLPMTSAQLVAALTPLTKILTLAIENFTVATFSVQETNFIISFDTVSFTDDVGKANLAENIKVIQQNLENLLNSNENQIRSHIAASFGLTDEQAAVVLNNIRVTPGSVSLLQKLEDESLIAINPDGSYNEISSISLPVDFPVHFNAYSLLHKVSLLVSKMKIETKDLQWFVLNHAAVKTINFSALLITATVNDYIGWHNLYLFLNFKSKFPEPEDASIRKLLDLAKDVTKAKKEIFTEIAKLTQWDLNDVSLLDTELKTQHAAGHLDYTDAGLYHRMQKCFEQMKLTGVNVTTMLSWASFTTNTNEQNVALQARQAVKSKYEQDDWLQKVTPLHDEIREKKRAALVEHHLESSQRDNKPQIVNGVITNPLYWEDANALFKYFLIDVEMSACQLTSRIKQALSSIQLFVQRCFLNLENRYVLVTQDEKEDISSPNAWSQWKSMKNYRIWEANRKIFFYPENWLEPELRDDKSPFFEELENELLQNEVTKENVEEAFQNFLYKVDEVSHLEVCGIYHQMEDLNLDEEEYVTNIVHVIGRTKATPGIFYYRTYDMNYSTWSAWEKIDVDITGDHVTPVVYNRKLYLFWLQFMGKPMKANKVPASEPTNGPTEAPEPMKVLEIQLGWSIKKSGGWTPKKISKQKLIHPWERPYYSYNLKPYYLHKYNELYIDIYLSTSKEFNDGLFYDPKKSLNPSGIEYGAIFDRLKNPTHLTKYRFDETYRPWLSSSFVFNGDVKDIELQALRGSYYLPNANEPSDIDSYQYVHKNFGEDGSLIKPMQQIERPHWLRLPGGMHFQNTHLTNNRQHAKNDQALRVLENFNTSTLLSNAISPFELVITQQDLQLNTFSTDHPMFYQDNQRAFFIKPDRESLKYRFMPFYHPYTLLFIRELNRSGIDGLLNRKIQTHPEIFSPKNNFDFRSNSPTSSVIFSGDDPAEEKEKGKDIVDFSFGGANSIYNWELFFHAPLMVACRLMQNQKFEEAMHWFHYIFNPTNIENYPTIPPAPIPTPQRYWVTKPFFKYNSDDYRNQRIKSILSNIHLEENVDQLTAWKNNPFKPHVIARYRPVAYQKNVVMKYLDNLIAWGDMLFKRDSIESINEASLLYMLAYEILGDRPKKVPNVKHAEHTFNELEAKKLDELGNARVDVIVEDTLLPISVIPSSSGSEPIPKLEIFYFCIPNNEYLTKYWDTVEDRLFKIRHCMNIQGVARQLPLFEPPIDPALLVKAAAAGMDLSSVLNDLSAPTPYYRFRIVVQKSIEFCNEIKILGEKLLSALEKKDVEQLSLLRSQHEIQLLEAVKEIRKKQIDEAVETIGSLNEAFDLADEKKSFYESREFMNAEEKTAMKLSSASSFLDDAIAFGYIMSGGLKLIPDFLAGGAGFGGSPNVEVTTGGSSIGNSAEMAVRTIESLATAIE